MTKIEKRILNRTEILDFGDGIYTGYTCDDKQVIILRQHDNGLTIKTLQKEKNNEWWLCHDYDEYGYLKREYFELSEENKSGVI